ncbi:MauE/DoxX family redox-associated membrane protein [Chryseobacterium sp. RR2-3-20]|uniref:MauE/DoxX family redox-associated membrane protein n=1 Tax=Chryseobacterium sp. RR2-3-20 TaxID=2787626 RepID=UPI001ADF06FA|nr:MauE/DoxX family redox-associated membrane protein [Chryseobacterium sp. RR2-3-20]
MKTFSAYFKRSAVYFFILLFCYAAISKTLDFENFQVQIGQSPLLSAYAGLISYLVIAIEMVTVLCLSFQRTRLFGLYAATSLMSAFTIYIYLILHYSDFVPCSCGGILEKMGWTEHLIFNIVCLVFGGIAVWIDEQENNRPKRRTAILLALSNFISCIVIILLFVSSEYIIKKENNFTRRFLQHPIEEKQRIKLRYDQYYIAGTDHQVIYLGSLKYPQKMILVNTQTGKIDSMTIKPESLDFPFKKLKLQVKNCFYYLSDGTVPVIFRGTVGNPNAKIISYKDAYFSQIEPADSMQFVIRTHNSITQHLTLGTLDLAEKNKVVLNNKLLTKQTDGVFDSDGKLISVNNSSQFAYLYSYRNRFLIMNRDATKGQEFKTIDTVNNASIKSKSLSTGLHKMTVPPLVVNQDMAVHKNIVMIQSKLKAKNEPQSSSLTTAVIDVYNIDNSEYVGSFYIYHNGKHRLTDFITTETSLYALIGNELVGYNYQSSIKKYFKKGEAENLIQE